MIEAVLLDAMGTLLELRPPGPALRAALRARGIEVDAATAERAMAAEIAHYRAHMLEAGDPESLAALRRDCARVLTRALGEPGRELAPVEAEAAMLAALRFAPYPEVPGALARLRAAGLRLVVVSNWDVSLHERLRETGIAPLLDGAVASAEVGAAKPDPAIFERALALAGVAAEHALHAGDSPAEDVEGARAAGIEAVLVARGPAAPAQPPPPTASRPAPASPVPAVGSLDELADLVGARLAGGPPARGP